MVVRVLIKRRVPEEQIKTLTPLLKKMRSLATEQPGYISGETLQNLEDPGEYLVISTWKSEDDWDRWRRSPDRATLQERIDALIHARTDYGIYHF